MPVVRIGAPTNSIHPLLSVTSSVDVDTHQEGVGNRPANLPAEPFKYVKMAQKAVSDGVNGTGALATAGIYVINKGK